MAVLQGHNSAISTPTHKAGKERVLPRTKSFFFKWQQQSAQLLESTWESISQTEEQGVSCIEASLSYYDGCSAHSFREVFVVAVWVSRMPTYLIKKASTPGKLGDKTQIIVASS